MILHSDSMAKEQGTNQYVLYYYQNNVSTLLDYSHAQSPINVITM
jgi:hypothetical protein